MSQTRQANLMYRTLRKLLIGATAFILLAQANCFAAAASPQAPDTLALANCNWTHPGVNPFMGDLVAAVDRYVDIPAPVRARLKARMAKRDYDEVVDIRRDSISGRNDYAGEITDMHFGTRQLCHRVTRTAWSDRMLERGLVYCEQDQCILVPTVCRNVSRIQRRAVHGESMHGAFVPAEAAGFPPVAGAPAAPMELAGPIGWAPGGAMVAESAGAGGEGMAPGLAFASAAAAAGGGGGSAASPAVPQAPLAVAGQQTARTDVISTEAPVDQAPVAPPVPEPETWALMAIGLMVLGRRLTARRERISATA